MTAFDPMETGELNRSKKARPLSRHPALKWIVWSLGVLAAIIAINFGVAFLVTLHVRSGLNADIALRRGRGERVLKDDFRHPSIPDSINAAHFINEAGKSLQVSQDDWGVVWNASPEGRLASSELEKLSRILQSNRAVLENVHRARACPEVDWQIDLSPTPVIGQVSLPSTKESRDISELLTRDIQIKHQLGDDAGAIESLRDFTALSRAVDHQCMLVTHFLSMGVLMMAMDRCRDISGGLEIAGAGGAGHAATRQQVNDLIAELLDDRPQQAAIVECWQEERMGAIDSALFLANSAYGFQRATFYSEADWVLHDAESMFAASRAPNWSTSQTILKRTPVPVTSSSHPVAALLTSSWRKAPKMDLCSQGDRRSAAILLAIRLYAVDHDGQLPPSLGVLAPDYVKSLPPDPFAGDGATFRYRAAPPAVLYSVGEDGVDGGGAIPVGRVNVWDEPDAVFLISESPVPSSK